MALLVPHIVFTNGRSGSNYITTLLNSHPRIVNYGEVLGDWTLAYRLREKTGFGGESILDYLSTIYRSRWFFRSALTFSAVSRLRRGRRPRLKRWRNLLSLGIKDFFVTFQVRGALDFFGMIEGLHVIHLRRRNVVRRYLSWLVLSKTGIAGIASDRNRRLRRVRVDLDKLIEALDIILQEDEAAEEIVSRHPPDQVFRISYEDYFSSHDAQAETNRQLFAFLGAEPLIQKVSEHRKILPSEMDQIVENWDGFADRLRGTKYEQWLSAP